MAEETSHVKWHGGVKETVRAPIDKAWAISSNFMAISDWVKTITVTKLVEGETNRPGCVRYVTGNTFPRADGTKSWAQEKLLSIDEDNHTYSYSMLDNNFGYVGYVAVFKMKDLGDGTCAVDWSYEVEPLDNRTEEQVAATMTAVYRRALGLLEDMVAAK